VKYLLGEASREEAESVLAWVEEDNSNRQYFNQFKQIWDTSSILAAGNDKDENIAWEKFRQRIHSPVKKPVVYVTWLRTAAVFLIIAAISLISYLVISSGPVKQLALVSDEQVVTDTLSDGSVITLNKASSLTYPSRFKGNSRSVALKGEGFFSISPDKQKPFIITVDSIQVTVVGTSFNIKEDNTQTEIVVETGIVTVTTPGSSIRLTAGEKTVITASGKLEKEKVSDKLYNYYRSKEFVCDDTPLSKLVEVINRAYDAHIIIGRDELRNLPINTTFYNESLDQVLNVISLTFDIQVNKNGDTIILE